MGGPKPALPVGCGAMDLEDGKERDRPREVMDNVEGEERASVGEGIGMVREGSCRR